MKNLFSVFMVFILFSCQNQELVPSNPAEMQFTKSDIDFATSRAKRGGWGAVWADATGGWAGLGAGAKIGSLFGPNGTVIGGMLGGVAGAVGGSLTYANDCCDCFTRPGSGASESRNNVNLVDIPNNKEDNPLDEIGRLHNLILFDLMKMRCSKSIGFDEFYPIFRKHIKSSRHLQNVEFNAKTNHELEQIFNEGSNNNEYPEFMEILITRIELNGENYLQVIDDLLREPSKLSQQEFAALSVLEYTTYFWSKFN